jgi:hypothetical protein
LGASRSQRPGRKWSVALVVRKPPKRRVPASAWACVGLRVCQEITAPIFGERKDVRKDLADCKKAPRKVGKGIFCR